jgi:nucleoside-diphosphate-sugar epimerase
MKNIIFGSGPLGRATAEALLSRGEAVRLVNRSGTMPNPPARAEVVKADAYDLESAKAVTKDANAIFNCLAPTYSTKAWRKQLPVLWGNILEAATANHAKLLIGDNLYMYDQVGSNIHEDLPMHSTTGKGQARIAAVKQHLEAHQQGLVQVAFVRGADFFGEHATNQSHLGSRVFVPMLRGQAAQILGNPDLPHSITYIKDFGQALALVSSRDNALGQAWHVPNAPAHSRREVLEMIAAMLGQPLKFQTINKTLLTLLGLFVSPLREVGEMMYQFDKPYVVNHHKFIAEFGDIHTPITTALEQTLNWFRALERQPSGILTR